VAQLTPSPDPRRPDREALARRRTALIEEALQQARALLAQGQLEAALDACQQALAFDETHAGALDLEAEINVAIGLREHTRAAATTTATPLPESASADEVSIADAVTRLDEKPRTALPVSAPGVSTPRVQAPLPAPMAAPAVRKATPGFSSLVTKAIRDKRIVVGLVAGLVLIVAVVAVLMQVRPAATGSVVIDAAPWGTITSIESEGGVPQPLPTDASTPAFLTLPAGDYRVTVAGPSPDSQPQQVSIRVDAAAHVVAPLVRFDVLTPEEYFEEYLASPSGAASTSAAPIAPAQPPAQTEVTR
jgi:hypothetical protein